MVAHDKKTYPIMHKEGGLILFNKEISTSTPTEFLGDLLRFLGEMVLSSFCKCSFFVDNLALLDIISNFSLSSACKSRHLEASILATNGKDMPGDSLRTVINWINVVIIIQDNMIIKFPR